MAGVVNEGLVDWGQVGAMTISACAEPRAEVPQLSLAREWPDPGCVAFHILGRKSRVFCFARIGFLSMRFLYRHKSKGIYSTRWCGPSSRSAAGQTLKHVRLAITAHATNEQVE